MENLDLKENSSNHSIIYKVQNEILYSIGISPARLSRLVRRRFYIPFPLRYHTNADLIAGKYF